MLIKTEGIHKHFDRVHVLKGISLEVNKAEIISVVGASGAGKTTLLQILGTLEKPDKGTVIMEGTDLFRLSSSELARFRNKHIGFIFQFHHLLPEFTALENVSIPGMIGNRNKKEITTRAMELFEYLGLVNRAGHKPSELSGGEQQRVAVARALINNPPVILADEPSGNLDSANAKELHSLFFSLRKEFGQTFIIVTHNESLAEMADRKLHIMDGLIAS
jgi:lipoprotein-releasing system ATP-binding protein